jgi:hypothetical protein
MYDSYVYYISSEIFGDVELQTVKYSWLDEGLTDKYVLKAAAGCPLDGAECASRAELLSTAQGIWPGATLADDEDYICDEGGNEVAEVEHQAADPVERTIAALGWPCSSASDREIRSERRAIAESLVRCARSVRKEMETIERLLDDAIAAYDRGDLDAVIAALSVASSIESDSGDDPSTSEVVHDLLEIVEEDGEIPEEEE